MDDLVKRLRDMNLVQGPLAVFLNEAAARIAALEGELKEAYAMRSDALRQCEINRDQAVAYRTERDALQARLTEALGLLQQAIDLMMQANDTPDYESVDATKWYELAAAAVGLRTEGKTL